MKFLIFDDEIDHIELIKRIIKLEFKNPVIHSSSNFEDFKKMISLNHYSFITLDLMMADISGFEALKLIRNSKLNNNSLVMIISANIEQSTKIKAFKLGADEFISKPFDMEELVLRIKNLLNLTKLSYSLREKEQIIKDTEFYIYNVFKYFPYPCFFLDLDLNIIEMNNASIKVFGDIKGKFDELFFPDNNESDFNKLLLEIINSEWVMEKKLLYKSGDSPVSFYTATFHLSIRDKMEKRIVAWLFDHTDEKLLKARFIQDEHNSLICKLSDSLTHEINNLVTGMTGYAELAKLKKDNKDFLDKALNIILKNCFSISGVIESLKQLSSLAKNNPDDYAINYTQIFSNILLLFSYNLRKKRIKLHKEFNSKGPFIISPSELQQILYQLLDNSINSINHFNGVITVKTWDEEDSWYISIKDNGCGIPDKYKDRIFDPFFSINNTNSKGLGLYIVKTILSKYNSQINYTPNSPQGSIFTIRVFRH